MCLYKIPEKKENVLVYFVQTHPHPPLKCIKIKINYKILIISQYVKLSTH